MKGDEMAGKTKSESSLKELKIVRKFLQRNNLVSLVDLLSKTCDKARGAKVALGGMEVPVSSSACVSFTNIEWDSDGFFQPAEPTRLTVPPGLGGRYLIQVATRWLDHREPESEEPLPDSYYYAFVMKNGSGHPAGNDARSTANNVEGEATGSTQHFMYETDLAEGDFVELWLWQAFGSPIHCDIHFLVRRVGS